MKAIGSKSRERYALHELESIVGNGNVTDDPIQCQAYTGRGYAREQLMYLGLCRRPRYVVLPGSTAEVSSIVRLCNLLKMPYVPSSTFWVIQAGARFRDDFVLIDLKRMDSLVINERNMYALVEPGVIYGQLLAEALKHDLYTITPGGGSQVSVIGNHLNCGLSPLCYRIPMSDRRISAAEWVAPDGEIVLMGSAARKGGGWFWGDGLGPDATGLLRGIIGWNGGLGIVTRMSVKLYPFQPEMMKPQGRSPETHSEMPPRIKFYNFTMPSNDALVKAMDEISRSQIGAAVMKVPVAWRVVAKASDRNEFWQDWSRMSEDEIGRTHILRVLLVGYTSIGQLEYEERVLTDIIEELAGSLRRTRQTDQSLFKMSDSAGMWMMTGGYMSNTGGIEGLKVCVETGKQLGRKQSSYSPPLMPQYGDPGWFQSAQFGHHYYLEIPAYPDPNRIDRHSPAYEPEAIRKVMQWYTSAVPLIEKGTGFYSIFDGQHTSLAQKGPNWHNYHMWCKRFKKEFDPMGLSNPPQPYDVDEIIKLHPEFAL